jgi:hypothetical protein
MCGACRALFCPPAACASDECALLLKSLSAGPHVCMCVCVCGKVVCVCVCVCSPPFANRFVSQVPPSPHPPHLPYFTLILLHLPISTLFTHLPHFTYSFTHFTSTLPYFNSTLPYFTYLLSHLLLTLLYLYLFHSFTPNTFTYSTSTLPSILPLFILIY